MRGCLAPKACAASGATADTTPMPITKATNSKVCASATAATTCSPRRPSSARSLVIIAIWPSCVSAIGQLSLTVSATSVRQIEVFAGVMTAPALVCSCMVCAELAWLWIAAVAARRGLYDHDGGIAKRGRCDVVIPDGE